MVYLPTFTIKNQPNVGKYAMTMDPMGIRFLGGNQGFYWINRPTRMCQEVSKRLVSGLYPQYIPFISR